MPESRYGAKLYYNAQDDPEAKQAETALISSQGTVGYIDFDVTEEYWSLKDNRSNETAESDTLKNVKKNNKQSRHRHARAYGTDNLRYHIIRARPSQYVFNLQVHGLKHRRRVYNFLCKQKGCNRHLSNVHDWNSHHRLQHRWVVFKCTSCRKVYNTPSSFKQRIHKFVFLF